MAAPSLHNAQFTLVRKGPHLRKPPPDFLMTDVCVYVCVYVCMYVFSQEIYGAYSLLSPLFVTSVTALRSLAKSESPNIS